MKEVITNLEELIAKKKQELSIKIQEAEAIKAEILKMIGALELAVAIDKKDNTDKETEDDTSGDTNESASDK